MSSQFELDTNNVLGFDFSAYSSQVKALAISKPDQYYEMRADVLEIVRRDAVKDLYKTLYHVLKSGKDKDGKVFTKKSEATILLPEGPNIKLFGQGKFISNYPEQKINDFCIQVAQELGDHINRAIDIILPDDFEKIAAGKLTLAGRARTIEIAP